MRRWMTPQSSVGDHWLTAGGPAGRGLAADLEANDTMTGIRRAGGASQVEGLVLVGAGLDRLGLVRAALDGDLALDDHVLLEDDLALDGQRVAVDERGGAVRDQLLHRVHELVGAVQLDVGRDAVAGLLQHDHALRRQLVRVGAQGEQVVGRLHRGEAVARDDEGLRAVEARDGGAHGRLELQHLRGLLVARVDRLGVLHDRQRQAALVLLELGLERLEVHPQVVGVEELVLVHVLELLLVLVGALRRLAQREAAGGLVLREVAALLVRVRALADLHHEGRARGGEVRQDLEVHGGAQVVRVGDEHVLEALLQELVQGAAAEHGRVQVAVAGRAPLVAVVGLPVGRRVVAGSHLRRLVLHELELGALAQVLVLGQGLLGVRGRGEGVHEHELQVGLVFALHDADLLSDEVQEGVAARDRQQRLRLVQAHASAQAAVQLQHNGLLQQRLRVLGLRQALVRGQRGDGVEGALGDHRVGAGAEHTKVVLEGSDGRVVQPLGLHLRLIGGPHSIKARHREKAWCGQVELRRGRFGAL
mmetsp:Transcript_31004/g.79027  ORF Transcript_31004/g.79027 Transcript_31004/m.79027 type:complete len:533 (-) Transcript_31004:21-1619(-)